jgi:hypothetical protein
VARRKPSRLVTTIECADDEAGDPLRALPEVGSGRAFAKRHCGWAIGLQAEAEQETGLGIYLDCLRARPLWLGAKLTLGRADHRRAPLIHAPTHVERTSSR